MKKIFVGLSGGVDSAVSAWLLKQEGYEVQGLFMKNWEREDDTMACTASQDLADVRLVCDHLGIVLHTANFADAYWNEVFTHFLNEYQANRTPNPDILCNKAIKFQVFLEYAKQLGADAIATGHYAHQVLQNKEYTLQTAADLHKDQTYFLYTLGQTQLADVVFPLATWKKPDVRALARKIGLPNHARKDSVGVCFIGPRNFKNFLKRYLNPTPGTIQTLDNQIIGEHEGLIYYTLGQRKGLQIGGGAKFAEQPWYVAAKEADTHVLRVVQGHDHPSLYTQQLQCIDLSWVSGKIPRMPLICQSKVRYRQTAQSCVVTSLEENRCHIRFDVPQRAVTPGQAIVFYQGKLCLGGGTIDSIIPQ